MTTPLYVNSMDTWKEYRDVFRRAKTGDRELAKLTLQPAQATPGCQKMLAFREHPDFVAEYALIRRAPSELSVDLASQILRWYCGLQEDKRIIGYEGWLSRALGANVREVWE